MDSQAAKRRGDDDWEGSSIESLSSGKSKIAKRQESNLTEQNVSFFDNIPAPQVVLQHVPLISNTSTNLDAKDLPRTPYKTLSDYTENTTPKRDENKSSPFTDEEKISFMGLYIDYAVHPFQVTVNTTMKDTCDEIWQRGQIESELDSGIFVELKSRFRSSEPLWNSIGGKKTNNKIRGGLSKGKKKSQPLFNYILDGMDNHYGQGWDVGKTDSEKREMLRSIKTEILEEMKKDIGICK